MTAAGDQPTRPGVGKRPARQEEALRENLRRRKAQARRRTAGDGGGDGAGESDGDAAVEAAGTRVAHQEPPEASG